MTSLTRGLRWDVSRMWRSRAFEAVGGALYNAGIQHERLARWFGRAVFGTDASLIYQNLEVLRDLPHGAAVLDVPCGGGLALRALQPGQQLRYVAADISPTMLERAERKARELGLSGIEFAEADIQALSFADGEFDLCLCVNGLHCLPDPAAAVRELARCLKPGGQLVGDCAVRDANRRGTAAITVLRMAGVFGPGGTIDDVERWLLEAGLRPQSLSRSGAVAHFTAQRQNHD
ncbi:MAG TPA: class I SAM-dependent methyltransferase [Mycobacterium sp.]|nr:class I SAM-dependent methyltransferase [Mycobacterium sp.]